MKMMIENDCCVSAISSVNSNFMNFSEYTVFSVKNSTYVCLFFIIIDVFLFIEMKIVIAKIFILFSMSLSFVNIAE